MSASVAGPAIGPIAAVTLNVPDLESAASAYSRDLGYRVGTRGQISDRQALHWGCPAIAGVRFATLHPEAGGSFAFRLVESPAHAGYRAFSTFGWSAAELIVRDVDALADELKGSGFAILGPPQDLSFTDAIRAMQVRGPAGEILYLTQFKRQLEGLPSPPARCRVDGVFIVIVAGPSLDSLLMYYGREFHIPEPQRMESRVKAMSEAFGLSPEHRYQIAAMPLQERCYIEADQMPPAAGAPEVDDGHLPPGIAIVSFANPGRLEPGCRRGPAGEIIEILPPA